MSDSGIRQITIFNSSRFKVFKEPDCHLAIVVFKGMPSSNVYQEGINLLIKATKEAGIHQWLIYCRDGCEITTDDQHWTTQVLTPKLANDLSLKKVAVIESKNIQDRVNLMSLAEILNKQSKMDIQFFELEHNARNWLALGCDFDQ
jgi:hypothetical protein